MDRIDCCLLQIKAVRDVGIGFETPYVARSRVGRLAMSTAFLVAETLGIPAPVLPSPINVREDSSMKISAIAGCCNRITELARYISQPSEPLDDRWKRGWKELLAELQILEEELLRFREKCRDG